MLLGGHHDEQMQKILLNAPETIRPQVRAALPQRSSLMAKAKTRAGTPKANRTISVAPSPLSVPPNIGAYPSVDLLPGYSNDEGPPTIEQFDNLQLEDFLKYVIVGESRVRDDKSQQIIRSLNGTWFRNTHSIEVPVRKLYNSLGIRRNRAQGRQLDSFEERQARQFLQEYTPPNIFPAKKVVTRQYSSKPSLRENTGQHLLIGQDSPLKINILRQMPSKN
jgi:hypothetical protein